MSSGRDTRSGGFPSRICGICTWCVLFRLFFNLSRLACTSVSLEIKVCCCDESSFDFSASEPSFVLQLPTSPSSFSTNSDTVSEALSLLQRLLLVSQLPSPRLLLVLLLLVSASPRIQSAKLFVSPDRLLSQCSLAISSQENPSLAEIRTIDAMSRYISLIRVEESGFDHIQWQEFRKYVVTNCISSLELLD